MGLRARGATHRTESVRLRRRRSVSARIARVRASLRSRRLRTQLTHGFLALVLLVSMMPMAVLIGMFSSDEVRAFSASQGSYYPNSCTIDSSNGGNRGWLNESYARQSDNVRAYTSGLTTGDKTVYLKCTNFGFSIPTNATITGIIMHLERRADTSGMIRPGEVRLVKSDTIQTHDKSSDDGYWGTSDYTSSFGSSSDLWGNTWTPANINASNFGVATSAWKTAPSVPAVVGYIDSIGVTVHYTVPVPTFEQSSYRWFENQDTQSVDTTFVTSLTGAGSNGDVGGMVHTSDGGYAVAGCVEPSQALPDVYLAKFDDQGALEWQRRWDIDNDSFDCAYDLIQTSDGGYAMAGEGGLRNGFIAKTNSTGVLSWAREWVGSTADARFDSIAQTTDGGYIVAGTEDTMTSSQMLLAKYTSTGTLSWARLWGGTGWEMGHSVIQTSDSGYAVTGYTDSYGAGDDDMFLAKFNSSGTLQWSRIWGGIYLDQGHSIVEASDDGLVITGIMDLTGPDGKAMLVKYNSSGTLQWSRSWSTSPTNIDIGYDVALTSDNGFAVGASTQDYMDRKMTLIKYDASGTLQWSRSWSELYTPTNPPSVAQTSDGGYALAAFQYGGEFILAKYDDSGAIAGCSSPMCQSPSATAGTPSPTTSSPTVPTSSVSNSSTDSWTSQTPSLTEDVIVAVSGGSTPVDVGSPLNSVAQNTATNAPEAPEIFRLRLGLHVGTYSASPGSVAFKLQYAAQGNDGLCDTSFSGESFSDVTTSTPIAYANNTVAEDGMAMATNANDPSHSGHTTIRQEYNEANNTAITSTIAVGQDGLWDFALTDNNATAGETYCLRLVDSSGTALNSYSVVPEITVPESDFVQENYRWYNGQDAVPNNTFVQTWGGTGDDKGEAVTQTSDGGYAVAGSTTSYGSGQQDCFVAKYDATGNLQWSRTWGGQCR